MNTYVLPPNTRTKMYADRVACCPLVSHVEYAPRALLRLEKDAARVITVRKQNGTDRRTDARPKQYAFR